MGWATWAIVIGFVVSIATLAALVLNQKGLISFDIAGTRLQVTKADDFPYFKLQVVKS